MRAQLGYKVVPVFLVYMICFFSHAVFPNLLVALGITAIVYKHNYLYIFQHV
jgi:hypothetical protein